jgi:hypothetical protein
LEIPVKQVEYVLKIVTDGTIDSAALAEAIKDLADFDGSAQMRSVEVVNFRVLPTKKTKAVTQ